MKFRVPTRIGKTTGKENTRYALGGVHVSPSARTEEVWLCATNSKMLAVVPTYGDVVKPELVPASLMPAGKSDVVVEFVSEAGENGDRRTTWKNNKGKIDEGPAGRFPNLGGVCSEAPDDCTALALDADLLLKLAQSIGPDGLVTLLLRPANEKTAEHDEPIAVLSAGGDGIGIFMPLAGDNPRDKGNRDKKVAAFNEVARRFCADWK